MRLTDCETFVVGNPPPGFGGRYFIFVKLVTDNNIIGYGEIYAASFSPHLTAELARDIFARYRNKIGIRVGDIEVCIRQVGRCCFECIRSGDGIGCEVIISRRCLPIIIRLHGDNG